MPPPVPDPTVTGQLTPCLVSPMVHPNQAVQGIFDNEDQVAAAILHDDPQPAYHPYDASVHPPVPKYLYRGQAGRFGRPWPPETRNGFNQYDWFYEGIIPSDYRNLEDWVAAGRHVTPSEPDWWGDNYTRCKQAAAYLALDSLSSQHSNPNVIAWLHDISAQSTLETFARLGSLAQHYAYQTAYLDWTSSIDIAFWMATHDWNTGHYEPEGDRVIYRVKYDALIGEVNTAQSQEDANPIALVDIRNTPPNLAQRPSAQHGWSLIGCESHNFTQRIISENIIEAFEFRNTGPGDRNQLTQDMVAPQDGFYQAIWAVPLPEVPSNENLQNWLDTVFEPETGLHLTLGN